MAEMDAEILHELVVHHRCRRAAGTLQERLQSVAADVVNAGQTQYVELLQGQGGLHRAERLDLAAHANGHQAPDPTAGQLLQHFQIWRQGGLVHPGCQHLLRGSGQHWHRGKAIVGALTHAQHRIHQAGFQGPNANPADNPRPLGALDGLAESRAEHALADAEIKLVFVVEVAGAAMDPLLHRLKLLVQKGTGLAHVGHPAAIAKPALAAEVFGRVSTALRQGFGPLMGSNRNHRGPIRTATLSGATNGVGPKWSLLSLLGRVTPHGPTPHTRQKASALAA